jgi:hypothetical protein
VASSCEHGNEPSGSIKGGKFLDSLNVLLACQEALSMLQGLTQRFANCGAPPQEALLVLWRETVVLRVTYGCKSQYISEYTLLG